MINFSAMATQPPRLRQPWLLLLLHLVRSRCTLKWVSLSFNCNKTDAKNFYLSCFTYYYFISKLVWVNSITNERRLRLGSPNVGITNALIGDLSKPLYKSVEDRNLGIQNYCFATHKPPSQYVEGRFK